MPNLKSHSLKVTREADHCTHVLSDLKQVLSTLRQLSESHISSYSYCEGFFFLGGIKFIQLYQCCIPIIQSHVKILYHAPHKCIYPVTRHSKITKKSTDIK